MKKDWLKDKLNERFDEFDAGLDLDQAWGDLVARRNPPKKKNRVLFFWFGSGLLGLILVGLFLSNQQQLVDDEARISETTLQTSKIVESKQKVELEKEHLPRAKKLSEKTSAILTNRKVKERSDLVGEENKAILDKKLKTEESVKGSGKEIVDVLVQSKFILPLKKSISQNRVEQSESVQETSGLMTETKTFVAKRLIGSEIENESVGKRKVNENNLLLDQISFLPSLMMDKIFPESRNPNSSIKKPSIADSLVVADLRAAKESKKPKLRDYYNGFGVSVAYGLHQREFKINDGRIEKFVNDRRDQEKALDVVEANAFYRRYFNNGLIGELGLGFQQTTYKFQFEETMTFSQTVEDAITAIHSYPDGTEETILGTIEETVTTLREYTYFQKYQQVNLSGMVGMQMRLGGRFGCGVFTGLEYGIFAKANGVSLSQAGTGFALGSLEDVGYRNEGILTALLRMEVLTSLGPMTELGFSIFGKSMLNDMINTNLQDVERTAYGEKRNYLMGQVALVRVF